MLVNSMRAFRGPKLVHVIIILIQSKVLNDKRMNSNAAYKFSLQTTPKQKLALLFQTRSPYYTRKMKDA